MTIDCQYRLHAYSNLQQQASDRQRASLVAWAVLIAATALATLFVVRFLRKERQREQQEMRIQAENEQRQRELLEIRIRQQEAEHARDEAERAALEMSSQLYASIGIMAGSYAHNIKNLLVRPNDLLNRCIEVNGLNPEQTGMLGEVKTTLGTVTERLRRFSTPSVVIRIKRRWLNSISLN